MTPPFPAPSPPVVLIVDDEAITHRLLEQHLKQTGHRALVANSAAAARLLVARLGSAAIDCVITDYNMPGESGLELLLWLKQHDPTLAVIMLTAATERQLVAATLRGGASDFLDKPIAAAKLTPALSAAIAATARSRRLAENERAVRNVGKTQHEMSGLDPEALATLEVCYHPCHAAGGDFINFFPLAPDQFLVLTADVSGHDLTAAFISAYFQGMARGMVESDRPITRVLERFNRFLLSDRSHRAAATATRTLPSVCACAVLVDRSLGTATLSNHGIPQLWLVGSSGQLAPARAPVESPLGWFDDPIGEPTRFTVPDGGQLWIWTDGLEDLAETLEVHPCSLATALLRTRLRGEVLAELSRARDDVLAVRIHLAATAGTGWLPLLHDTYHGGQVTEINRLQIRWERCLRLALPELSESRCYDLLLTLRETVLNALKHGCHAEPGQLATLTVTAQPDRHQVRCTVSDSGPGHAFDGIGHLEDEELPDLHRGLALIHRLATRVTIARRGAELTLDFTF